MVPTRYLGAQSTQPTTGAAKLLPNATPNLDQLILQVPGDGGVAAVRQLLGRLHEAQVDVAGLAIHTPDLDDVFFAVTGHPSVPGENAEAEAVPA